MTAGDKEFMNFLLVDNGYLCVRKLPDGTWAAILRLMHTYGLCIGLDTFGYSSRYCFADLDSAVGQLCALKKGDDCPVGYLAKRVLHG